MSDGERQAKIEHVFWGFPFVQALKKTDIQPAGTSYDRIELVGPDPDQARLTYFAMEGAEHEWEVHNRGTFTHCLN